MFYSALLVEHVHAIRLMLVYCRGLGKVGYKSVRFRADSLMKKHSALVSFRAVRQNDDLFLMT